LRVQVHPETRDLIARLIQDEQTVWQSLLNNKFGQEMKTASSDNVEVAKGLKWYMIVRFSMHFYP
jgi:hypothetical protein